MEIKNFNNSRINAYKSVANTKTHKDGGGSSVKKSGENVDKIEFDFAKSLSAAKANVASSVDAEVNTARLEALQQQYLGDACPVSAEEVADAIVNN